MQTFTAIIAKWDTLEAFRQSLTHCLLDHARPGETDQRSRFGDYHVANEGKTG